MGSITRALLSASLLLLAFSAANAQTADEILAKVDANMSYTSIKYNGRMAITVGGETRYKTMAAAAMGSTKAFAEFTNPEDRGTRYLKLDKNLWIYFPKEQDTVKISGHLLKEGMMGSDVSYEDALESSDFHAKYFVALKGEDTFSDRRCFVIELAAKAPGELAKGGSPAAYDKRVLWVDAERYITLKEEMYAKSGKLLKVNNTLEVARIGDRWFPARSEYVSKLRNNTKTIFSMSDIQIDAKLDPNQFTMSALTK